MQSVDIRSARMNNNETFWAFKTVKYVFKSRNTTAGEYSKRCGNDLRYASINRSVCSTYLASSKNISEIKQKLLDEQRMEKLKIHKAKSLSKEKS